MQCQPLEAEQQEADAEHTVRAEKRCVPVHRRCVQVLHVAPACVLKGLLMRAQQAFLRVLDECTVEQFLTQRGDVVALLDHSLSRRRGPGKRGVL